MFQVSWPWPPASVSPSWDLTNTPRCCRSWRDMWRYWTNEPQCLFIYILQHLSFFPCMSVISRVWYLIFACFCPPQEAHPDYSDILKATATFKSLVVRKKAATFVCVSSFFKKNSRRWCWQNLEWDEFSFCFQFWHKCVAASFLLWSWLFAKAGF